MDARSLYKLVSSVLYYYRVWSVILWQKRHIHKAISTTKTQMTAMQRIPYLVICLPCLHLALISIATIALTIPHYSFFCLIKNNGHGSVSRAVTRLNENHNQWKANLLIGMSYREVQHGDGQSRVWELVGWAWGTGNVQVVGQNSREIIWWLGHDMLAQAMSKPTPSPPCMICLVVLEFSRQEDGSENVVNGSLDIYEPEDGKRWIPQFEEPLQMMGFKFMQCWFQ